MTEREIFLEALEIATPDARAAFLKGACGRDTTLRGQVDELLKEHFANDSLLAAPALDNQPTLAASPPAEAPARMIGRYKLLEQIGEGGFGEVWMAEQREPVKRRVALKLIKLGMDSRQIVARFEAERQALAMMDHPNIAKIFDAGTTGIPDPQRVSRPSPLDPSEGRPYFVMELVRGIRITDYCDQNQLSTKDRLDLFILVCQAIQHAHQKGIIHRDIKPSNILVTLHDGVPVPKVIDFGIAKATQQELTDKTVFTQFQQFIGTPAYISPEQAEMSGLDIDTRADIYSLGVLLYELLVGQTPFDAKEMMQGGLEELRQIIREREPLRPSTKLNTLAGDARTTAAKRRQTEIGRLVHQLQGDLDWIVMKCLEKDRVRRYETANGLASDIQRYLNNEAVLARPPSTAYRFQKMVRRNRLAVFAGAAVAAALACGVVLSLWQAVRARHAEREARRQLYVSDMVVAEKALREGNLRRADELLLAHWPKAGVPEDALGFEYHYLRQQCNGEQDLVLSTNDNVVLAVAYSPDGKLIATGTSYLNLRDYSGELKLYAAESGRLLAALATQSPDGICSVAFSADGKRLAAGGAGSVVTIWDVATRQILHSFYGRMAEVGTVAFSPDGRLLAATVFGTSPGQAGRILVWDTETRQEIKEFQLEINRPEAVAFSPDGKWLAYVDVPDDQTEFHLWEIEAMREGKPIKLPLGGPVYSMQFSPDSKTVALGAGRGLVALLDFNRPMARLEGHADAVLSVAFSRDGRLLATGSADNTVRLWDLHSRQSIRILRGHRDSVKQVVFSPDGTRLISASLDKTARVWPALSKEDNILRAEGEQITAIAIHPSGKLLAIGGTKNTLRIVDPLQGEVRYSMTNLTHPILSLAFSPDGFHLLAGGWSRSLRVWQTEPWRQLDSLTTFSPEERVHSLRFSNDGRYAFAGEYGFVSVWDTGSWRMVTNLLSPGGGRLPVTLAVSPNDRFLAAASGQVAQLFEIGSWRSDKRLHHLSDVGTLAFAADSQTLITGSADARVRLWDISDDSSPSAVLGGSVGEIAALAVSPDGNTLAVADASPIIKLWNLTTRKELFTLVGHQVGVSSLAFSPDGHLLVSGGADATVRLWRGTPEIRAKTTTRQ